MHCLKDDIEFKLVSIELIVSYVIFVVSVMYMFISRPVLGLPFNLDQFHPFKISVQL